MRAGPMRDRIRIERQIFTVSRSGQSKPSWLTLHECWANVRALSQSQQTRADQSVGPVTHEIRIRAFSGVDHKCRIVMTDYGIDPSPVMQIGGQLYTYQADGLTLVPYVLPSGTIIHVFLGPLVDEEVNPNLYWAVFLLNTNLAMDGQVEYDPIGEQWNLYDFNLRFTSSMTGSFESGDVVIDDPLFQGYTVPDTSVTFQVDGVIDPDGKRSDMIIQAIQAKR